MTLTKSKKEFFTNCLHEDIDLISDQYGFWDVNMQNKDIVNLTGTSSLENAIIITILTRYKELNDGSIYDDFGCRVYELVKSNYTNLTLFKIEQYIKNSVEKMNRVKSVNDLVITDYGDNHCNVWFSVTSINDEVILGDVNI